MMMHIFGLKAIGIYRDRSEQTPYLNAAKSEKESKSV